MMIRLLFEALKDFAKKLLENIVRTSLSLSAESVRPANSWLPAKVPFIALRACTCRATSISQLANAL